MNKRKKKFKISTKVLAIYLAHTAPDPPNWFVSEFCQKPEIPVPIEEKFGIDSGHKDAEFLMFFCDDDFSWKRFDHKSQEMIDISSDIPKDYKKEVELYQKYIHDQFEKLLKWENDYAEHCFFQWKAYYAKKLMIQQNLKP